MIWYYMMNIYSENKNVLRYYNYRNSQIGNLGKHNIMLYLQRCYICVHM